MSLPCAPWRATPAHRAALLPEAPLPPLIDQKEHASQGSRSRPEQPSWSKVSAFQGQLLNTSKGTQLPHSSLPSLCSFPETSESQEDCPGILWCLKYLLNLTISLHSHCILFFPSPASCSSYHHSYLDYHNSLVTVHFTPTLALFHPSFAQQRPKSSH